MEPIGDTARKIRANAERSASLVDRLRAGAHPIAKVEKPPYRGPCVENCETCGGAGWVRLDVPFHHPMFGKLYLCPKVKDRRALGHFGLRYNEQETLTWERVAEMNGASQAVKTIQEVIERGWGWVYLYGDYGMGKSLMLKIAVAEALRKQQAAGYANMVDIIDDFKLDFDPNVTAAAASEKMTWWQELPLLAIDELEKVRGLRGTEEFNWTQERIFKLLNHRYDATIFSGGVTLISSNVPPSSLPGYLASRINDERFYRIELRGVDARLGMTPDQRY